MLMTSKMRMFHSNQLSNWKNSGLYYEYSISTDVVITDSNVRLVFTISEIVNLKIFKDLMYINLHVF
jgi:hypothetical protein